MNKTVALACQFSALLCISSAAAAQDVAITNVRIVVGTGSVIESGTIVVRGGKIASGGPGAGSSAHPPGVPVINRPRMTAAPRAIHRPQHPDKLTADPRR